MSIFESASIKHTARQPTRIKCQSQYSSKIKVTNPKAEALSLLAIRIATEGMSRYHFSVALKVRAVGFMTSTVLLRDTAGGALHDNEIVQIPSSHLSCYGASDF